jgi:hypothetical protein
VCKALNNSSINFHFGGWSFLSLSFLVNLNWLVTLRNVCIYDSWAGLIVEKNDWKT